MLKQLDASGLAVTWHGDLRIRVARQIASGQPVRSASATLPRLRAKESFTAPDSISSRDGQRKAAFGPDFEAKFNGFADILERLRLGHALAHTTGDRRAFGDPRAGFVSVDGHGEFHGPKLPSHLFVGKLGFFPRQLGRALTLWGDQRLGVDQLTTEYSDIRRGRPMSDALALP